MFLSLAVARVTGCSEPLLKGGGQALSKIARGDSDYFDGELSKGGHRAQRHDFASSKNGCFTKALHKESRPSVVWSKEHRTVQVVVPTAQRRGGDVVGRAEAR